MTASNLQSINSPELLKAGDPLELTLYGVKATFRYCPPGTFLMGSPKDGEGRRRNETQREVTLTRGFWLLETSVTQTLWKAVTGKIPSRFRGMDARPVERVCWEDCNEFIRKLNDAEVASDVLFDFPTEAEWEYACRAGTTTRYNCGDDLTRDDANFGQLFVCTTPVRSFAPNAWGFYDMHGNVWEWCADWRGDYPQKSSTTDPQGPQSGSTRILRGGSWDSNDNFCRSASRGSSEPFHRSVRFGFRPALRSRRASESPRTTGIKESQ